MEQKIKDAIAQSVRDFRLPRYEEIPDVGLYLDQATRYVADYLVPLDSVSITGSMVSNYVKKGLVDNPVRKQYNRRQIAYLMFIAVAKTALTLENIQLLLQVGMQAYDEKKAYDYFCQEFENVLFFIFGLKDSVEHVGKEKSDEKTMLRNTIITVAHKIYLDKYFSALSERT